MSRIDITSAGGAPLSDGILQTANPLDATLQVVTDNAGNSSTLLLSTDKVQINSTLKILTDNAEILDIENSSGNRFNINRDLQKINLDFASNPTGSTDIVGAIRTFIDGTNLSDVAQFQENGQVTLTERLKIESDSTVTTQTSSVIQSSTVNANLVIAPNGTGALVAQIPDGTATGGNARGANAVDFQRLRSTNTQVASGFGSFLGGGTENIAGGIYAVISGGASNTASSNYSTVSGGQSNKASTGTHATVVGGSFNTASNTYNVAGGASCVASGGNGSVAIGYNAIASGISSAAFNEGQAIALHSTAFGQGSKATSQWSVAFGRLAKSYLIGQIATNSGFFTSGEGDAQQSLITSRCEAALTTAATTVLSLDGTGVTNLIIPNGNNRLWNVVSSWSAIVTAITGTATGVSVGDVATECNLLAFKRVGGTSSVVGTVTNVASHSDLSMASTSMSYTAGASQEMALTFTGPTFVGGGSVTCRVVCKLMLTEVAY